MSKPRQASCEKFVEPLDEMTPSALAGPGVSSPTARTSVGGVLGHRRGRSRTPRPAPRPPTPGPRDQARVLHEPVDQELPGRVQHGGVVARSAVVEADHHPRRRGVYRLHVIHATSVRPGVRRAERERGDCASVAWWRYRDAPARTGRWAGHADAPALAPQPARRRRRGRERPDRGRGHRRAGHRRHRRGDPGRPPARGSDRAPAAPGHLRSDAGHAGRGDHARRSGLAGPPAQSGRDR